MEARQVKGALSAMRNKTDKHDARGIAQILRSGWYSRVHVKSMESHHIRMLLSSRKAVLSKCVDLENEVSGLFKIFGIKLPPGASSRERWTSMDTSPSAAMPMCEPHSTRRPMPYSPEALAGHH